MRTYLAKQAGVKPEREFYLLAALGEDLAGAVTVVPLEGDGREEESEIRPEEQRQDGVLHFSLAGVQLKFSAVAESCGGLTIPVHGVGGSWIVKLPSTQFAHVPENEYAMLELARAVGIDVPAIQLIAMDEIHGLPPDMIRLQGKALAVERFDRTPEGDRIHMEDFAQVFACIRMTSTTGRSYANIAAVLWAETGPDGAYEFVRRLVFSVLIGNGDMHLKNWSLLYPGGRTPVLSPAYDLVATRFYIPGDSLALSFGDSRSLDTITLDQVRRFSDTAGLPMKPVWDLVRETVERTTTAWKGLAQKDVLPGEMRDAIGRQIESAAISEGRRARRV
jgi:serine/threonine-protein kinase HipA